MQDEVRIKTKSLKPLIRSVLFVFVCMLYNLWQFFKVKGRVPFRRFVYIMFRRSIVKTAVFAAISILKEKGILRDKDPPDGIYEGVIEKFGYSEGISLHEGC